MEKKVNLKEMSTKQRIGYIWDYYKWHIIGAVIAVSVTASILHHFITYREPLLNVIMINGGNNAVSADNNGFNEFLSAYGYDPKISPIVCSSFYFPETDDAVQSAYLEQQALTAIIAAGGSRIFFSETEQSMKTTADRARSSTFPPSSPRSFCLHMRTP